MNKRGRVNTIIMILIFVVLIIIAVLGVFGCGIANKSSGIPAPKAGLVLVVNGNQGVYANCRLFEGCWTQDDFISVSADGYPKWSLQSIKSFKIPPAFSEEIHKTYVLDLFPRAKFTLFVIWTRFTGQVLDMSVIHFDTSANPFREYHINMFGHKTYADKILKLPHVNPNIVSQLHIHKELRVSDWLKALIGY
ncbi:MAG: hypothetical protein ABH887_00340 [bacterium]